MHIEKNTRPNIDFTISIDANNRTAYYSDYSPFYCGHVFEEFKIQGNHFETTDNLCDFSNEAIYELAQSIYHAFTSNSPNVKSPFLSIDRTQFDKLINDLKLEQKVYWL